MERLVLLARDPTWLHAYWEIHPETVAAARRRAGAAGFDAGTTSLCVYRGRAPFSRPPRRLALLALAGAAPGSGEGEEEPGEEPWELVLRIPVGDHANRWYLRVDEGGRAYRATLGRALPDGSFLAYVTSNPVITPLGRPSSYDDEEWPPLGELYRTAPATSVTGSSPGARPRWRGASFA